MSSTNGSSSLAITVPFLPTSKKFPPDIDNLRVELSKTYIDTAIAVNARDIAIYDLFQVVNGQQWFSTMVNTNASSPVVKRQAFRQVFQFGAIVAGATLSVTHNITTLSTFTFLNGVAITAIPDFRPLPYASVTANANIELLATPTQITIKVGAASPNVSSALVVAEWLVS